MSMNDISVEGVPECLFPQRLAKAEGETDAEFIERIKAQTHSGDPCTKCGWQSRPANEEDRIHGRHNSPGTCAVICAELDAFYNAVRGSFTNAEDALAKVHGLERMPGESDIELQWRITLTATSE